MVVSIRSAVAHHPERVGFDLRLTEARSLAGCFDLKERLRLEIDDDLADSREGFHSRMGAPKIIR